jgi:class 3 adenylate cyclase
MSFRELHYRWQYELKAAPDKLWRFVADTNRFNRDTGVPSVEPAVDSPRSKRERLRNARRRLRLSVYGMDVEWEEQPFEWVRPFRFGVTRTYSRGPMAQLRALAELTPRLDGGTTLTYNVWVKPASLLGRVILPLQLRFISAGRFARAFKKYDELATTETISPALESRESRADISSTAMARSQSVRDKLLAEGADKAIVDQLIDFVLRADDFLLARIRPYELADEWKVARRPVLDACLRATRAGLLDLQWDMLCPLCRGAKESGGSLREINPRVHCDTCSIDFSVNFDRSVEVTFRPNGALRRLELQEFCMGSPQRTPHIVVQQLVAAHSSRTLSLPLEPGRYRLRALEISGGQEVDVSIDAALVAATTVSEQGWPVEELRLSTQASLQLENATGAEQLLLLERVAWSDQAATAAEVTALQVFRDLFSSEALRPGEQISVGTLTVLFTDLRNSTQMYREIGDATAFGRVMNHFEVLKQAISAEDGAVVKTIGDAVMAVFREPAAALKAMLRVQQLLGAPPDGSPPLTLKAGIHRGPCIAVTLNERLDYFGSTVNMAARLEGLSTGNDVVISRTVHDDPAVRALIESPDEELTETPFEIPLKGFDQEQFLLWRVAATGNEKATDSHG